MTKYYVSVIKCERWKKGMYQKDTYYTGMTSNPKRRLEEHRNGLHSNWMLKNNISPKHFVYIECVGTDYWITLNREKQIKKMNLKTKLKLIEEYNA